MGIAKTLYGTGDIKSVRAFCDVLQKYYNTKSLSYIARLIPAKALRVEDNPLDIELVCELFVEDSFMNTLLTWEEFDGYETFISSFINEAFR